MATKRKRKQKVGSGVRKNRAGKNCSKSGKVTQDHVGMDFVKHQHETRWPTDASLDLRWALENDKLFRSSGRPGITPPRLGFPLLEELDLLELTAILIRSSLKVKPVKRYPGWVLQRTYNLKNRVLDFTV